MRAAALVLAVGLAASAARAEVSARCSGSLTGDRVLATVEVSGLVEKDMVRLIRLGLVGRIRIEAALVRKRRLWLEHRLAAAPIESSLTYDKAGGRFLLDGRREVKVDEPLSFGRLSLRFQDEIPTGAAHSLEIQVRLQVVTASSLSGVAKWITADRRDQESDSAVSRWVVSAVVNDLTRTGSASCPVQERGGTPPSPLP